MSVVKNENQKVYIEYHEWRLLYVGSLGVDWYWIGRWLFGHLADLEQLPQGLSDKD